MTQSEKTILERWVLHRDADAFARIVAEHSAMVYYTCLRILKSPAEAEDAAQECFLALASGRGRISASLAGWLHTLATHHSLNRLRAAKRRHAREIQFVETAPKSAGATWNDIQEYVDEAIEGLPPKLRDPLVAHFLEGQTYEAIAAELHLPRTTVASRVQTAIERVRALLRKHGVPVPPSALAGLMAAPLGQAVPAGLTTALYKLAIAGTGGAAAGTKALITGGTIIMVKKAAVGVSLGLLIAVLAFWFHDPLQAKLLGKPATTGVASQDPAEGAPNSGLTETVGRGSQTLGGASHSFSKAGASNQAGVLGPEEILPAKMEDMDPAATGGARTPNGHEAIVSGYVLDEKGYAFPDVSIRAEVLGDIKGSRMLASVNTKTDSNGLYTISLASGGYVNLFASATGYLMQKRCGLRLTPGTEVNDVAFTMVPGKFLVAGTVEDQDGQPIEGAVVNLRRNQKTQDVYKLGFTYGEADGRFSIAIEWEGNCDFSASKEGYGAGFFPNIPTGTDDARFVLRGPGGISGRVTLPDGTPVPGARIDVIGVAYAGGGNADDGGQPMQLQPVFVATNEQGEYLASGLGEGYGYDVLLAQTRDERARRVDGTAPWIFQALEGVLGTANLGQHRNVRVAAGEITKGIDFIVRPVAHISGKVTDAASGVPAYHVTLLACKAGTSEIAAWTWSQPDGSYTFDILVTESTSIDIRAMYLTSLGSSGPRSDERLTTVDVAPGASVQRDLVIDAPCSVPIVVTDETGAPIADAPLRIRFVQTGGSSGGSEVTDANGRYTLYGIPPNVSFAICIVSSAYGQSGTEIARSGTLTGAPGETLPETHIAVVSDGGLQGLLLDSFGQPIPRLPIRIAASGASRTPDPVNAATDDDGQFIVFRAFPGGQYDEVVVTSDARGYIERATIQNVSVAPDAIIDLGSIFLTPAAPKSQPVPPKTGQE